MSLKIWNGVKFKSTDPEEIIAQLFSVKKKAIANSKKYITSGKGAALAVYAAGYTKDSVFDIDLEDYKQLLDFQEKLEHSFNKRLRSWDDPAFKFSVVVIPYKGVFYGLSYHEEIEDNRKLLNDFIEEYHYQNQTDQPEDIDDAEWSSRSEVWNNIFDRYVSPAEAGFVYEIVKSDDLDFDDIKVLVKNYREWFADGWVIKCKPKAKSAAESIWDQFRETDFKTHVENISGVIVNNDWQKNLSDITHVQFTTALKKSKDELEKMLNEQFSDILTFETTFEKVRKDWL